MGLEDLTGPSRFLDDLVVSNPVGSTDAKSSLDDHIRGIKNVLKNTFPNLTGAVTPTQAELNKLAGLAATAAELGYLAGVTSGIQAQLDTLTADVALRMPIAAPVANHVRAGNMQIKDGSFDPGRVDIGTTELLIGPTGSGATTIWTALDVLPSSARVLIARAQMEINQNQDLDNTHLPRAFLYCGAGDVTLFNSGVNAVASIHAENKNYDSTVSAFQWEALRMLTSSTVFVPLDSSQRFKARASFTNNLITDLSLVYGGFSTD